VDLPVLAEVGITGKQNHAVLHLFLQINTAQLGLSIIKIEQLVFIRFELSIYRLSITCRSIDIEP
jgi:hypothetical protein